MGYATIHVSFHSVSTSGLLQSSEKDIDQQTSHPNTPQFLLVSCTVSVVLLGQSIGLRRVEGGLCCNKKSSEGSKTLRGPQWEGSGCP